MMSSSAFIGFFKKLFVPFFDERKSLRATFSNPTLSRSSNTVFFFVNRTPETKSVLYNHREGQWIVAKWLA